MTEQISDADDSPDQQTLSATDSPDVPASDGNGEAGEATDPSKVDGDEAAEPEEPESPEDKLVASLGKLKDEVQDRVRDLLRSKKALEQICRGGAIENLELVQRYTGWLRAADLSPIELDDERATAVGRLDQFVERRKRKRRMHFLRGLNRDARQHDLRVEKLSEAPLTVSLHPFTLEADFEADEATLSFARCTVDTVDLDPQAVLEARQTRRKEILEVAVDSEQFFEQLHRAYRTVLEARGESAGERVDLVDLLAPLALYNSDVEAWRDSELGAISPYPRYLLAFQLTRLRRDGLLEHQGHRLDLGTATGGSTENKEDVLFLPTGPRDGQYYLSIRFTSDDN